LLLVFITPVNKDYHKELRDQNTLQHPMV